MLSESQSLYLKEVLGLDPRRFETPGTHAAPPAATTASAPLETVVMTSELSPEETQLLKKILASARLTKYRHVSTHQEIHSGRVLVFGGELAHGRHHLGQTVWWSAPALSAMLGQGPGVTENKKFTWNLVQQMMKQGERECR